MKNKKITDIKIFLLEKLITTKKTIEFFRNLAGDSTDYFYTKRIELEYMMFDELFEETLKSENIEMPEDSIDWIVSNEK